MSLTSDSNDLRRALSWLEGEGATLDAVAEGVVTCLRSGGSLLTCGNGGSAAQARHLVTELLGRFRSDRRSLPATFLGGDASLLTCIANDFGWDHTFARPLSGLGRAGDVLVAFSTSGDSGNVVRALEVARELGLRSFALLGKTGGRCKGLATWELVVPSDSTPRIQEIHLVVLHYLCEAIEAAYPPGPTTISEAT